LRRARIACIVIFLFALRTFCKMNELGRAPRGAQQSTAESAAA